MKAESETVTREGGTDVDIGFNGFSNNPTNVMPTSFVVKPNHVASTDVGEEGGRAASPALRITLACRSDLGRWPQ